MVQVNMEDHRLEDFRPSASKVKPFAGKGHTLGRFVFNSYPSLVPEKSNFNFYYYFASSPTPTMKDEDGSPASSAVPIPSGSASDNESNEKRYFRN